MWLKSRRTNIHVKRSDLRPQPEVLGSILKIGVPVAVQDGCIQVAFMFITVIANHRGLVDAAAVGLVEKMISFLFIVPSSMGATVSALTAQNAGAGKGDRARQVLKDAMTISVVYGCLITVLMWLVAPAFIGFFAKNAAVVTAGTGYMRSYIFDAIFAGIHICFSGFFRCVWQELHRLCAQRASRGAHSRAGRVAAVERLFRYVVSHGHRLAVRIDFVGGHLCCRVYRAQPARGF